MPDLFDVEALASAKGLPAGALRRFGLSDRPEGGVRVEYAAPDGRPVRSRLRLALGGPEAAPWESAELPERAYWHPSVAECVRERDRLLLCEGESSCWTAWHAGFGAVGLPGGDRADTLDRDHVTQAAAVVVVLEPDDLETYPRGRDRYLEELVGRLREIGYPGEVRVLDLDGVAQDLNALHRSDPSTFAERLERLVEQAPVLYSGPRGTR